MVRLSSALCFLLFGLTAFIGVQTAWLQRASLNWPTTIGRINKLDTVPQYIPGRRGSLRREFPIVLYSYSVGGKQYESGRVSILQNDELRELLSEYFDFENQRWKSAWIGGRAVTVHYDRGDPSYAYLLKSASGLPIYLLTFCLIPLIIAIGLAIEGRKSGFWRSWIAFLIPEDKPRIWILTYLAAHPLVALGCYGWEVASLRSGPTVLAICVYYLAFAAMIPFGRFAMSIGAIPRRSLKQTGSE